MFSDPTKNIEQCGIQPGMDVVDLGAGSGFYTLAVSRALAATGRVYAVDAQKDLLTKLKNQATHEGLYNVDVIWGDIEKPNGTHLREGSIDLVLLCNVLFQIENKKMTLEEIKRILKPGGRLLIVDWTDTFGGIGPHKDAVVTRDKALDMSEHAGFSLERDISAGSHHYGMLLKKL